MNKKAQYQKAIVLFYTNHTKKEVRDKLKLPHSTVNKWYRAYEKNKASNLKQMFIADFGSGKISIDALARNYNIDRRKLLKLKHKYFGKGSLKQKRMYQMHKAEIPTRAIADFYNVALSQVHRSIRLEKALIKNLSK